MGKLAINGGEKVRKTLFPAYEVIGKEEERVAIEVIRSGVLSKYLGCWEDDFYGGPQVRALEEEWAAYFGVKHAVAVNSATSALYCAAGAIGLNPGDEVIVSPYTMSASATAPLIYNAIPVFADIEKDFFCLNPDSIEERITEKTRAIIIVNIFGQPYDVDKVNKIARKHNLFIVEDNAQGPGAVYGKQLAGTLGDIGVFSLNYHKHIHCGEGGIAVTNNDELAERLRLIRNHAEAVVGDKGYKNLNNMIGFNLRMTEIEASIAREQLKKLENLVNVRIENVNYLRDKFEQLPCVIVPPIRSNCKHVFYMFPLIYNEAKTGISRERFVEAVRAELMPTKLREGEGVRVEYGYVKPLYLQPIYQERIAYGKGGYPLKESSVSYEKGICPVCERMHFESLITHELMKPGMSKSDLDDVFFAFEKVYDNIDELK